MDSSQIDKMFVNFNKLNDKEVNPDGTGLGMSICNQILQKMGGSLKIKSKPGYGTIYKIEITSLCKLENLS